jgi:hypothetical protein
VPVGIIGTPQAVGAAAGSLEHRGYKAKRGYDLTTGIGTIDAARFAPELARAG